MKKILSILIIMITVNSFAQSGDSKRDRIQSLKVSVLSKWLQLTESEAQKFWPIYNDYDKVTLKIKLGEIRKIQHEVKNNAKTISDERASELLKQLKSAESRLCEENNKLNNKLQNVLTPKKIILLKIAEDDFKMKLIELFKKMKQEEKKK